MRDNFASPFFGAPPREYSPDFFAQFFRVLEIHLQNVQSVGPIRVSRMNINDLPTSATGLRSGDLWNDMGQVRIVT